jgi:hypothetical protein
MSQPHDIFYVPDMDPEFEYHWMNRADRNVVIALNEGWEVVTGAPEIPDAVRLKLQGITGQSKESGGLDQIRTRGDLVLMRMKKDLFETRVAGPDRARLARHSSSLDTMVEQANDSIRASLSKSRQQNIRQRQVFQTTDSKEFPEAGKS